MFSDLVSSQANLTTSQRSSIYRAEGREEVTPLLLGLFNHLFILRSSICRRSPQSSEGECTREMEKKEIRGRHSLRWSQSIL